MTRIRAELPEIELPASAVFVRLRPGYLQRACGAWSWLFEHAHRHDEICGSPYSVGALLRAPALQAYTADRNNPPEVLPAESAS